MPGHFASHKSDGPHLAQAIAGEVTSKRQRAFELTRPDARLHRGAVRRSKLENEHGSSVGRRLALSSSFDLLDDARIDVAGDRESNGDPGRRRACGLPC